MLYKPLTSLSYNGNVPRYPHGCAAIASERRKSRGLYFLFISEIQSKYVSSQQIDVEIRIKKEHLLVVLNMDVTHLKV